VSRQVGWRARADGAVALELAGTEVTLRPSGALWLEAERALIAADLHLEKGSAYAARGQLLPPYDTLETLARLAAEAESLKPRTVVLLGDTLHDEGAEARLAAGAAAMLGALAGAAELVWIVGNHDASGPRTLPGAALARLDFGGLELVHEPAPGPRAGEVAGHLHPCAKVAGRGGAVRRRCFVTDGERLVAPAFGAFAGGLNVLSRAFTGLFAGAPLAVTLGAHRAHPVGWRQLTGD
jgi:uncharacterized protein